MRQKGFTTMSNVLTDEKADLSLAEVKPDLISAIEGMLQVLNADKIPSPENCAELQSLLLHYINSLSKKSYVEKDQVYDVQIEFTDVTGEDVKSNDIIADLLRDQDSVEAFFVIGLRKLAKEEELPLSESQVADLKHKGYIATLKLISCDESVSYLALTSKGWLCFQRSFIIQQLRKKLGYTALLLPEWLAVPQQKWNQIAFKRAAVLRDYYINILGARDFMIFSFPENNQLLFGCSAGETSELIYTCAGLEHTAFTLDEQKTLLNVIRAQEVAKVALLCTDEKDGKNALASLKLSSALARKVDLITMEEKHE